MQKEIKSKKLIGLARNATLARFNTIRLAPRKARLIN
jgi:hypothetical protein